MNQIISSALIFALSQCFLFSASATSTPWYGTLDSGYSLTIPADKILIIEQVSSYSSPGFNATLTVTGVAAGGIGAGSFYVEIFVGLLGNRNAVNLATPLRLGPGMTIQNINYYPVSLIGIALDASEFLASANPAMRSLSLDGGMLSAIVDSRTTVPTITTAESSTDLQTWTTTGTKVAKSLSNPRLTRVSTPADAPQKFIRASSASTRVVTRPR